jgi:hypothetical protein
MPEELPDYRTKLAQNVWQILEKRGMCGLFVVKCMFLYTFSLHFTLRAFYVVSINVFFIDV